MTKREGEDTDKEDTQLDGEAGDVLQEEEGAVQEGGGARHSLRCGGGAHRLLFHWKALRVLQLKYEADN